MASWITDITMITVGDRDSTDMASWITGITVGDRDSTDMISWITGITVGDNALL